VLAARLERDVIGRVDLGIRELTPNAAVRLAFEVYPAAFWHLDVDIPTATPVDLQADDVVSGLYRNCEVSPRPDGPHDVTIDADLVRAQGVGVAEPKAHAMDADGTGHVARLYRIGR
jgi:hypothetical protein